MIKNQNFSHGRLADFKPIDGDVVDSCNLSQKYPHTEITTVPGLTFTNCNLVNCKLPPGSTTEKCNIAQISRCGHLNDDYDCADECEHMTSSEEILVDGVVADTIREYKDKVVI